MLLHTMAEDKPPRSEQPGPAPPEPEQPRPQPPQPEFPPGGPEEPHLPSPEPEPLPTPVPGPTDPAVPRPILVAELAANDQDDGATARARRRVRLAVLSVTY